MGRCGTPAVIVDQLNRDCGHGEMVDSAAPAAQGFTHRVSSPMIQRATRPINSLSDVAHRLKSE